ncbi:hypothetical protein [Bdellovibrio sp. BCCA]|uniref:hypothetical protein n=1 Tax=Bdellovibrio sp. BCCA TaxID=3136281 RepID=UPI0030EFF82D
MSETTQQPASKSVEIPTKFNFEYAFRNTDFGSKNYPVIVYKGLLKVACGYGNGSTLHSILMELGYAEDPDRDHKLVLTYEGRMALYELSEILIKV